jgi:hypothetical protein
MSAIESLRANPKYLDRLNLFLTEDEVGVLFLKAIVEKVLGRVPTTHDQTNHGTIFRSGFSAGATDVLRFIQELDPVFVAQELAQRAAEQKLKAKPELPSETHKRLVRTNPHNAPEFPMPAHIAAILRPPPTTVE